MRAIQKLLKWVGGFFLVLAAFGVTLNILDNGQNGESVDAQTSKSVPEVRQVKASNPVVEDPPDVYCAFIREDLRNNIRSLDINRFPNQEKANTWLNQEYDKLLAAVAYELNSSSTAIWTNAYENDWDQICKDRPLFDETELWLDYVAFVIEPCVYAKANFDVARDLGITNDQYVERLISNTENHVIEAFASIFPEIEGITYSERSDILRNYSSRCLR